MILNIKGLYKSFPQENHKNIEVLKNLNLQVEEGETVAVVGQSGSGKSTLLSMLAGLDCQSSGSLRIRGKEISEMSEVKLTQFRAENIGIIFQQFYLMPHLTAIENVSLPLEMFGYKDSQQRSREALLQVGLAERETHFPHQLSGGESQRVAIARAIVIRPSILLADEPTGNLDNATGIQVSNLLFDLVKTTGMTLLLVTHNIELAQRCSRQLHLNSGTFQ
ncbi:MAG: ABC transporter ATP-binding protein [SAR324 cluster bacterium]|nr:ABC transporter ATP-binding protein [SAR324 cluster bacterium]MEC9360856.1 ABC transporter ATP-binding protein [SAR324 cluster bacterium]MED5242228.1 ABC transporter ATP-binding protein [SAR324 cluster bacterium]MED6340379.1 ABC transporter ATP-binding protein [SAR324 cluster bacterium]